MSNPTRTVVSLKRSYQKAKAKQLKKEGSMNNPISIMAKDKADFIKQIKELAKTDKPEGTHYLHLSAKLLDNLLSGRELREESHE